jgi:hypothetical protein
MSWTALAPEYGRLEAYHTALIAAVAVMPGLTSAQVQSSKTVINSVRWWLDRLGPRGDLGAALIAGEFEARRWVAIANEQGKALQIAWEAISPLGTAERVWREILVPTVVEVKDTVKAGAAAVASATPWVALGLAAVAVIYIARGFR